jgi:hypothetical protein
MDWCRLPVISEAMRFAEIFKEVFKVIEKMMGNHMEES